MKIYYNGTEKGSIDNNGKITFTDSVMNEIAESLFSSVNAEEMDDGGVAFVYDELSLDLKIAELKRLGFEVK